MTLELRTTSSPESRLASPNVTTYDGSVQQVAEQYEHRTYTRLHRSAPLRALLAGDRATPS